MYIYQIQFLLLFSENPEVAPDEADDQADLSDEDVGDGDVMDVQDRNKKTQVRFYYFPLVNKKHKYDFIISLLLICKYSDTYLCIFYNS